MARGAGVAVDQGAGDGALDQGEELSGQGRRVGQREDRVTGERVAGGCQRQPDLVGDRDDEIDSLRGQLDGMVDEDGRVVWAPIGTRPGETPLPQPDLDAERATGSAVAGDPLVQWTPRGRRLEAKFRYSSTRDRAQ